MTNTPKVFQKSEKPIVTRNLADLAKEAQGRVPFEVAPLDPVEAAQLETLLAENCGVKDADPERFARDVVELKTITAEIRAIGKQGTILTGERVHKAREIMKPYGDGTFTKWMESTFGTRKTGYNLLHFYECYTALPTDAREQFIKLPQRTAYIVASKKVPIEARAEIVREHHSLDHDQLVALLQDRYPVQDNRTRKTSDDDRIISELRKGLKRLARRKGQLSEESQNALAAIKTEIESILSNV